MAWDAQYGRATPEDWRPLIDDMTNVQRMVHMAGRVDSVGESEMAERLFREARETYRQTLQDEVNKVGCSGKKVIPPSVGPELSALRDRADWAAASVANTYNLELAKEIKNIRNATPTANRHVYAYRLYNKSGSWDGAYWTRKATEVAQVETMTTVNAATADFYERNKGLVEVIEAYVVPFVAECPVCQEAVAGNPYKSASEIYGLYGLPVHPGCPHMVDSHAKKLTAAECKELWLGI
jgi:hypothetical protein